MLVVTSGDEHIKFESLGCKPALPCCRRVLLYQADCCCCCCSFVVPDCCCVCTITDCCNHVNGVGKCWLKKQCRQGNAVADCCPVCSSPAVPLLHWTAEQCFGVLKGVQVVAEVDQPKYVSLANRQPKSLQRLLVLERLQDPGNLVRAVQLCMHT